MVPLRPSILAALTLIFAQSQVWAKADPCRTKSRQLTLMKNCFSGDMAKGASSAFFTVTNGATPNVNYCYNSLIEVEHKPGQAQIRVHVFKDGKDGELHAYEYNLSPGDVSKDKSGSALILLKGLKGDCFSPTHDREACNGGLLKAMGLKDTNKPMILAIKKTATGFAPARLTTDQKEIDAHKPKELDGGVVKDPGALVSKIVGDVHRRLANMANAKIAAVHAKSTTPKKLADSSEQFRYCSMALEGYLKAQKLSDPFTAAEKNTLNQLISYMNNDPNFERNSRAPASSTPVVKTKK